MEHECYICNNPSCSSNYRLFSIIKTGDTISFNLSEYQKDDIIKKLECKHYFHSSCINEWVNHGDYCPCCKSKI